MTLSTELLNAGIINAKEAAEFEKILIKEGIKVQDSLPVLYHMVSNRMTGNSNYGSIVVVVPDKNEPDAAVKYPQQVPELIDILYREGLISEKEFNHLKEYALLNGLQDNFIILHMAQELNSFYRSFTLENQKAFAELLDSKSRRGIGGMLDPYEKKRLIADIEERKLNSYLDFFDYCYGCKRIDYEVLIGQKNALLKTLKDLFNELCYGAFTIIELAYGVQEYQEVLQYYNKQGIITIDTGARKYTHGFTFWRSEDASNDHFSVILDNLLTFVNKLLADFNSSYRLTGVSDKLNHRLFPKSLKDHFICRVEPQLIDIFDFYEMQKRFLHNVPTLWHYRLPFSYTQIEYAVYHVKKCGLLSHLTSDQLDEIMQDIYSSTYREVGDLLSMFPDTVAILPRTVRPGQKPYHDFLLSLNTISHGVLHFTDIIDGSPDSFDLESELKFKLSFRCNGLFYELDYSQYGNELSEQIIYYVINEIIRKDYSDYQLIDMINGEINKSTFLFASNEQSNYLDTMKLRNSIDKY